MADAPLTSNTTNLPYINLAEQSADPAAPAAGRVALYVKAGSVYVRRSTGDPAAAGGVPALAQGRLAIGDGSNTLSALALGASGQVVTADSSGYAAWASPSGGGGGGDAGHIFIPAFDWDSYAGTVPVVTNSTSVMLYTYILSSGASAGDAVTYRLDVPAGTYTLRLFFQKQSNLGVLTLTFDGATLGTIDLYNSTPVYNQTQQYTGLVVSSGGLKTLVASILSKHASSGGFRYMLTCFSLWRTA